MQPVRGLHCRRSVRNGSVLGRVDVIAAQCGSRIRVVPRFIHAYSTAHDVVVVHTDHTQSKHESPRSLDANRNTVEKRDHTPLSGVSVKI